MSEIKLGKKGKIALGVFGFIIAVLVIQDLYVGSTGGESVLVKSQSSQILTTKTPSMQSNLLLEAEDNFKQGYWEEAVNITNQVLEATPEDTEALSLKGMILVLKYNMPVANISNLSETSYPENREQLLSEGLQLFNKSISLNSKSDSVWFRYGYALSELKKYNESLEAYNKVLEIAPKDTSALNNKGLILRKLGRDKEALDVYETAISLDPMNHVLLDNYQLVAGHYPPIRKNGVMLTVLSVDTYGNKGYKMKVEVENIGSVTHFTSPLFFEGVDKEGNVYTVSTSTFGEYIKTYPSATLNSREKVNGEVILSITSSSSDLVKIKYNSNDVQIVAPI